MLEVHQVIRHILCFNLKRDSKKTKRTFEQRHRHYTHL